METVFYAALPPQQRRWRMVPPHFRFVLYQRDDCHLCDLALSALAEAGLPEFESVFIDGDSALEARYGARVPVLRESALGAELDWPFDSAAVAALQAETSGDPD